MSRHQFRFLVVANQLLSFGWWWVRDLSADAIPAELISYFEMDESVMGVPAGDGMFAGDLLYNISIILTFLCVVAAVGLCLAHRWGRNLFFFCFVVELSLSPLTPFYISTGWRSLVGYLYTITQGMILALMYFSHLRRMFENYHGTEVQIHSAT